MKDNCRLQKAQKLPTLANENNSAAFYASQKCMSIQKYGNGQLFNKEKRGGHFHDLFNCESIADQGALDELTQYPIRGELDLPSTAEELQHAVDSMMAFRPRSSNAEELYSMSIF